MNFPIHKTKLLYHTQISGQNTTLCVCFLTVIKPSQYKLHTKDKTLSLILGTGEQHNCNVFPEHRACAHEKGWTPQEPHNKRKEENTVHATWFKEVNTSFCIRLTCKP